MEINLHCAALELDIEGIPCDYNEDVHKDYFTSNPASEFMDGDVTITRIYLGDLELDRKQAVLMFGEEQISQAEDYIFERIAEEL